MQGNIDFYLVFANHTLQRLALFDGDAFEFIAIACRVFAALTRIALAANAVHRHGQSGVGFGADGTQRHRTCCEALDDFRSRFDFVDRNRFAGVNLELKQATQCQMTLALVIDDLGIFLVGAEVIRAGAVLQFGNGIGRPHMLFATHTPGVFTARVESIGQHRVFAECSFVHTDRLLGHFKNADAFDTAWGSREILVYRLGVDTNRFKQLGTAIRHIGRHAHLGHDLGQAFANRLDVVVDGFVGRQICRQIFMQSSQRFQGQVGMHGLGTVASQHSKVVDLARAARLDHQTCVGA